MVNLLDYAEADPGREEEQRPTRDPPPRLQSPSSILTFKQCPRKYFYRYIARLPSKPSIHLVRGSVAHKVLERFYATDLSAVPDESFPVTVKVLLQEMFRQEWDRAKPQLDRLDLSKGDIRGYFDETKVMVHNFFHYLIDMLDPPYAESLDRIRPRTEVELRSQDHHVRGFADAVHEHDGTYILDYKTSSRCEITPEYELQLAIYGMIFAEIRDVPDEVGIFFLKHGQELRIPLTDEMVARAKREVHAVHDATRSRRIEDYPLKPGPLCKWSTGQCDYYELCFGNKTLDDFEAKK